MKGWMDRLAKASLGVTFAWLFAVVFVVRTVMELVLGEDAFGLVALVARLIGSLLVGGVLTFVISRQRRKSGGASTMVDITEAIKRRRLPEHADPAVWIPALEWRRRLFRRQFWLFPVFLIVIIALGAVMIVTVPGSPIGYIVIALFLAMVVVVLLQARRTLPRIDALLGELRGRAGGRPPLTGPDAQPAPGR